MPDPTNFEYDVFISYSQHDETWVSEVLLPRLEDAGLKVFSEDANIRLGELIVQGIKRGIRTSRKIIVVLTPDYLAKEWRSFEMQMVACLSPDDRNSRILPILLTECTFPVGLRGKHSVNFANPKDDELEWLRLIEAIGDVTYSSPLQNEETNKKTPVEILVAKLGLTGTIATAFLALIGVVIPAYFSYQGIRTQLEIPIHATETAEARLTAFAAPSITPLITITPLPSATFTDTLEPPSPTAIQTSTVIFALILTGTPTHTPTVTYTPTSTQTSIPTHTPTHTSTPTYTLTPTYTPGRTPTKSSSISANINTPDPKCQIAPGNVNQVRLISRFKTDSPVFSVAISPQGDWIAAGESYGWVTVRNTRNGDMLLQKIDYGNNSGASRAIRAVAFSPNGQWLAAAGDFGTILVWDTSTWSEPLKLTGHGAAVSGLSFSSDGTLLASGSDDQTIQLWQTGSWNWVKTIFTSQKVKTVIFSPDDSMVAAGLGDATIGIWSVSGGPLSTLSDLDHGPNESVISLAFSPDSKWLVSGSHDNDRAFHIWNFQNKKLLQALSDSAQPMEGNSVVFSPDGQVFVTGSSDMTLRIWRTANRSRIRAIQDAHADTISSIAFSKNGNLIITGSLDRTIRVWGICAP